MPLLDHTYAYSVLGEPRRDGRTTGTGGGSEGRFPDDRSRVHPGGVRRRRQRASRSGRTRQGHRVVAPNPLRRHRHPFRRPGAGPGLWLPIRPDPARPAGGRQNRHHQQHPGRVGPGLHPAAGGRGLDRQHRQHADGGFVGLDRRRAHLERGHEQVPRRQACPVVRTAARHCAQPGLHPQRPETHRCLPGTALGDVR